MENRRKLTDALEDGDLTSLRQVLDTTHLAPQITTRFVPSLNIAIRKDDSEVFRVLKQEYAVKFESNIGIFCFAIEKHAESVCKVLYPSVKNSLEDDFKETALRAAIFSKNLSMTSLILNEHYLKAAQAVFPDILIMAVDAKSTGISRYLLENLPDIDLNVQNRAVYRECAKNDLSDIFEILLTKTQPALPPAFKRELLNVMTHNSALKTLKLVSEDIAVPWNITKTIIHKHQLRPSSATSPEFREYFKRLERFSANARIAQEVKRHCQLFGKLSPMFKNSLRAQFFEQSTLAKLAKTRLHTTLSKGQIESIIGCTIDGVTLQQPKAARARF